MSRLFTAADDKRLIKSSSTESDELFLVLTMFHEGRYNPDEASTRTTSAASTAHREISSVYRRIEWTTAGDPSEILSLNNSVPLFIVEGSDILVKVHAAALKPTNWKQMQGWLRLMIPKIKVHGSDIAGTVKLVKDLGADEVVD
ncbi:hypothetical protein BGZ72_003891 [Mortierella alpina]|nr:hypothetical protein BGZ72_003891 [Mortierella alpina]